MSEAAEKLKPLLAALTREDRAELVDYLVELDEEWDEEFIEEINRRVAQMESGEVKGVPAEEVLRRVDERLRQIKRDSA